MLTPSTLWASMRYASGHSPIQPDASPRLSTTGDGIERVVTRSSETPPLLWKR